LAANLVDDEEEDGEAPYDNEEPSMDDDEIRINGVHDGP
jgi:hypothetical protein